MKKYWIYSLILVGIIIAIEYDLVRRTNRQETASKMKAQQQALRAANASGDTSAVLAPAAATPPEPSLFESRFVDEAQKISQLQSDPKAVDEKIDELARSMQSTDIHKLSFVMENTSETGDNRAMAVELLSRVKNEEALKILKEFVASHETGSTSNWNRNREFESVLRAQAIEGIASYPQKKLALSYLNSLADTVDEAFLKDRIARSGENLKGRAPSAEKQDEAALKKLVE